jgi:hypothetical protein
VFKIIFETVSVGWVKESHKYHSAAGNTRGAKDDEIAQMGAFLE